MLHFHYISFHEKKGTVCNPNSVVQVNLGFFELYIFVVVKESLDNIYFVIADNGGFAEPVYKVDHTIGLPDIKLFSFRNTYEHVRFEQWFENDLFPIAPLFLNPVQWAIV